MALLKFGERFWMPVASPFVDGAEPIYSTASLSFSKISPVVSTMVPKKKFWGLFTNKELHKPYCDWLFSYNPHTQQTTHDNG